MKKLLILSGKGGTGKTTTAAAFIRFSGAPAFADCDVDAPNLHLVTPLSAPPERQDYYGSHKAHIDPNLCVNCGACQSACRFGAIRLAERHRVVDDFSCEGCGVCELVCTHHAVALCPDVAGTQALYPSAPVFSTAELKMGRGNSGKLVSAVKTALYRAAPDAPFCIIDGSPGIGCPVIASMSGVDLVLIVAEPSLSGLSDLKRLLKTASVFRTQVAVCVNKYDLSPETADKIEAFCRNQDLPFVGRIPFDPTASVAINTGSSVADVDCPMRTALFGIYTAVTALLKGETAC